MKLAPFFLILAVIAASSGVRGQESKDLRPSNLDPDKLVAWCIVPFDAKKRNPAERATMLRRLGMRRSAYDWRKEHVPEFEEEIRQYRKHGIEFFAFWDAHEEAFKLFEKYKLHPQIWRTAPSPAGKTQDQKVAAAAQAMEGLARRTAELGCKLGLYNHGGWGGEPTNLVAVCQRLRDQGHGHVGIVYNWHHGHGHIADWAEALALMKPYLLCLNLNGMNSGAKPKILALAQGEHELSMLGVIRKSGYDGPIGILDHQGHLDAEETLRDNLVGLAWLRKELKKAGSGGAKPRPKAGAATPAAPPATSLDRKPLEPNANPYWQQPINRDRIYDFYAKQARARSANLAAFPGLDGGNQGHWGNQNDETTWTDGRVRGMDHGSMVSGVFRGAGKTIPRAVSVRLGKGFNAVFDPDSLRFVAAWKGNLANWSDVRHGFLHGIPMGGRPVKLERLPAPGQDAEYLGLYRNGDRVVFGYREDGKLGFRSAEARDGKVVEIESAAPRPGEAQWPQRIETQGKLGDESPYAIDTLTLPHQNPQRALFFVGGLDFVSERRLAICNIHGDVWICDRRGEDLERLSWKRFAAGLHQPLGLRVVDGVIHVMGRDQITALHDRNNDDEADFYQSVARPHQTSPGGHDYITGLQRDRAGRWLFASANQGLCRVSPDGNRLEVLATGLRNPNGLAISPSGEVILTNLQEGNWTPASAICDVSLGGHFGAGGPRDGARGYLPPMLYLPRGIDNSSGGQVYVDSERWGPVRGQWIHFSGGFAKHFLMLREKTAGGSQAAAVVLPGSFLSGAHRGRFSPFDGQLYVAGAQGWANYGVMDGCLQRVRFTGDEASYPYPIAFETYGNGVLLTFAAAPSEPLAEPGKWFAQHWNYRYGPGYGSPEYSVTDPRRRGHDRLEIRGVHRVEDGRQLFLEIPQLRPVDQLHLHFDGAPRLELFATLRELGKPYTAFPGYKRVVKTWGTSPEVTGLTTNDPALLMRTCAACHHASQRVVGPSLADIRQRYPDNPDGIVTWAMNPQNRDPQLPPMPSFRFLGEERLRIIADAILAGPPSQ